MVLIHLRITLDKEQCSKIAQWVRQHTMQLLSVYEVAEKGHSHNVFIYTKTLSTFRQILLKEFPYLKGKRNEFYAISQKDDIEAQERYICKGKDKDTLPEVVCRTHQYTDALIALRHQQYWEENDKLKKNSGTVKEQKTKSKTFVQIVVEDLPIHHNNRWDYTRGDDKRFIFDEVMKKLGQHGKVMDSIVVRRIINGVWNIIDHERFKEKMFSLVYPDEEEYRVNW